MNPLQARDDEDDSQSDWGPIQKATPAIVGGVLLLIFIAYIIWKRNRVTKVERIFVPRCTRMRVLHSSAAMTLDGSMRTASLAPDPRRTRQYRSGSSDSQTPLTSTNYNFDYPPNETFSDSHPPIAKRRPLRWWWLFGSRPQEIKSAEPGSRWHVDGPDGSSSGHDHNNNGHEEYRAQYVTLEAVHEGQEEIGDDVIRIGENFASVASTPMTQHFPEQARVVRGMSPVPECAGSPGARTPVLPANVVQSSPGTPVSSFLAVYVEYQTVTHAR